MSLTNAAAHLAEWVTWNAAADACIDERISTNQEVVDFLRDECDFDGTNWTDALERIDEHCTNAALSVEVRSEWQTLYDFQNEDTHLPGEFQIYITVGGPALRIAGELDTHQYPTEVRLEHADQSNPWSALTLTKEEEETVLWFAHKFYFGS